MPATLGGSPVLYQAASSPRSVQRSVRLHASKLVELGWHQVRVPEHPLDDCTHRSMCGCLHHTRGDDYEGPVSCPSNMAELSAARIQKSNFRYALDYGGDVPVNSMGMNSCELIRR
jgi:hypothetical protein